jgi:hypothetical protein
MTALELVNETLLVVTWPAALALLLARDRRGLFPFLAATAVAGALIFLFGGLVGGILRGDSSFTYSYLVSGLHLRLRLADFLQIDPFYGQAFPVYSPRYLLANPIVPLAFAAASVCLLLSRRKDLPSPALWLLGGVAALGYLVPGSIDFGYPQNVDAIRYVNQTSWAVGPLAVVAGGCLMARLPAARIHWGLACLGLALSVAVLHPGGIATACRLLNPDLTEKWREMRAAAIPQKVFQGQVSPSYRSTQAEYQATMARVREAQSVWGLLPPYDLNRRGPGWVLAAAGEDRAIPLPLDREAARVVLDGSRSGCEECSIAAFAWTDEGKVISRGSLAVVDLGAGEHVFRLVVQDDLGRRATDEVRLSVAESLDGFVNLALAANGGRASASGSYMGLDPANAIDGRVGGALADSWTSDAEVKAFWQVDLCAPRDVRVIRIRFRSDHREDDQTRGIELLASDDPSFAVSERLAVRRADAVYPKEGVWKAVVAPSRPFRYVRLAKTTSSLTSLEEIEIFCPENAS